MSSFSQTTLSHVTLTAVTMETGGTLPFNMESGRVRNGDRRQTAKKKRTEKKQTEGTKLIGGGFEIKLLL